MIEVDGQLVLADGHHRLFASQAAGKTTILAKVWQGTRRDALRWSIKLNARSKLNFTNEDKKRAVKLALDEFGDELSNRQIAHLCCVSPGLVDKIKKATLPTVGSPTGTPPEAETDEAAHEGERGATTGAEDMAKPEPDKQGADAANGTNPAESPQPARAPVLGEFKRRLKRALDEVFEAAPENFHSELAEYARNHLRGK